MLIRSFQRRDMRKKRLFTIIWLFLGGLLIRGIVSTIQNHQNQELQLPTRNLHEGQIISFKGEIVNTNKFPIYTHTIKNQDGVKMYLKSSSINLNTYEKQVITLKGKIQEIYKGTPLVDVSEAKISNEGLDVKDNKYVFSRELLIFDFKGQSQLSAKRTDKEIEVYYGNEKVVSIERFSCSNLFKNNSCADLIEDYAEKDKDAFSSYYGYTYFKHAEKQRTMFDEDDYGYIFKDIDDDVMLNISSNIKIIDADDIINMQEEKIKEQCGIESIGMGNILEKNPKNILVEFAGKTKNNEDKICNISFNTEDGRDIIESKS